MQFEVRKKMGVELAEAVGDGYRDNTLRARRLIDIGQNGKVRAGGSGPRGAQALFFVYRLS